MSVIVESFKLFVIKRTMKWTMADDLGNSTAVGQRVDVPHVSVFPHCCAWRR
jgi:hypothetical protein